MPRPYAVGVGAKVPCTSLPSFRDHHGTNEGSVSHQVSIGYSWAFSSLLNVSLDLSRPDLKSP